MMRRAARVTQRQRSWLALPCLAALALTGCGAGGSTAPQAATLDEEQALADAAEMLPPPAGATSSAAPGRQQP